MACPPGYLLIPLSSFPAIIAGKSTFPSGKATRWESFLRVRTSLTPTNFPLISFWECRGDPCGRPFFYNLSLRLSPLAKSTSLVRGRLALRESFLRVRASLTPTSFPLISFWECRGDPCGRPFLISTLLSAAQTPPMIGKATRWESFLRREQAPALQ